MRLLAAPDKFRGTLTAHMAAAAIAAGASRAGCDAVERPRADGGEGTLDVLGGGNRSTTVTGPLREPVVAAWRLGGGGPRVSEEGPGAGASPGGAGGPGRAGSHGGVGRRGTIRSARRAAVSGSSSRRPSRKARGGSS